MTLNLLIFLLRFIELNNNIYIHIFFGKDEFGKKVNITYYTCNILPLTNIYIGSFLNSGSKLWTTFVLVTIPLPVIG